jgi:hypothetical protein
MPYYGASVLAHEKRLSPLSQREALRLLPT